MLTSGRRYAVWWFGAYAGLVLVAQIVHTLRSVESILPTAAIVAFFILNIVGVSLVTFLTLHYFVGERDRAMALLGTEQQKSDRLLLNILPKELAAILKDEDQTIAQHFPAVSVLFADIVEFTPMAARMTPDELVGLLNHVYDTWGDTVNIASRMESHGLPERIQVTKVTRDLINDEFNCVPRGLTEVKGKGDMETWFLEGVHPTCFLDASAKHR